MTKKLNNVVSGLALFAVAFIPAFLLYKDEVVGFFNSEAVIDVMPTGAAPLVKTKKMLPESIDIAVPFTPQAPLGNWRQPWQDACEEASVLMAVAWARGFDLTPELAAEEILKQVQFEESVFGYHRDTGVFLTARLFTDFYRYKNIEIIKKGATVDNIKKELAAGHLVIVPLAGEIIARENAYFTSPPHYHMVVIRGYSDKTKEFIVNEPGTKRGHAFRYSYAALEDAIHDWTGSADTILFGDKAMIIVRPLSHIAPPRAEKGV